MGNGFLLGRSRGAAYIRVSTDDQTEFSPAAQIRAIEKYCLDKKIELCSEYIYREACDIIEPVNSDLYGGFKRIFPMYKAGNLLMYATLSRFFLFLSLPYA